MKRLLLVLLLWPTVACAGLIETPVSSLPSVGVAGESRIVTDGLTPSDCGVGGGRYAVLCTSDGNGVWTAGGGGGLVSETDTLQSVATRGSVITTADSFDDSVKILDANGDGTALYTNVTTGPKTVCVDNFVEAACGSYEHQLASGQTLGVTDHLGADIFRVVNNTKAATFGGAVTATGALSGASVSSSGALSATGQISTSNLGIEFTESDTNPACAAGNYNIYADASESKLKKCVNGVASDLAPASSVTEGVVRKAADETVNNSTTVQDDDELFIALDANSTYVFEGLIIYNSSSVADFQIDFTVPAGASGRRNIIHGTSAITSCSTTSINYNGGSITAVASGIGGIGADCDFPIVGTVTTAGTSGNFQVQWAQNTLEATNTVVKAGSYLRWRKL